MAESSSGRTKNESVLFFCARSKNRERCLRCSSSSVIEEEEKEEEDILALCMEPCFCFGAAVELLEECARKAIDAGLAFGPCSEDPCASSSCHGIVPVVFVSRL